MDAGEVSSAEIRCTKGLILNGERHYNDRTPNSYEVELLLELTSNYQLSHYNLTSKNFLTSWSGGKDSCFALIRAVSLGMKPVALLNMLNENGKISRSHAIPQSILFKQSRLIGIPIITVPASWNDYENLFIKALSQIKSSYNVETAVFGDIDLQEHRDWEEKVCRAAGLEAVLPLWKHDRKELVIQMINSGIETYIVSCNEAMGEPFLGKKITPDLIAELEEIGVDPCGETGEYHTLVVNCSVFKDRMNITFGKKMKHDKYWFVEMAETTAKL